MVQEIMNMTSARPTREPMATPAIAPLDNLVCGFKLFEELGLGVRGGLVRF